MMWTVILILSGIIWLGYATYHTWYRTHHSAALGSMIKQQSGRDPEDATPWWVQLAELTFLVLILVHSANWFGFEETLFFLVVFSGVLWVMSYFRERRYIYLKKSVPTTGILAYGRSLFPIFLVVFFVRSFLYEGYRIPSGSLLPTLQVGDFVLVNKFDYGLRVPIWHQEFLKIGKPQVGDIMVFHWPVDPSTYFIKRVVGTPGDRIRYENKILYLNGKACPQKILGYENVLNEYGQMVQMQQRLETINGVQHSIYVQPDVPSQTIPEFTVPKNSYYVIGDNRDSSLDSRAWGYVPDLNVVGKAIRVLFSWKSEGEGILHKIRWERTWQPIISAPPTENKK